MSDIDMKETATPTLVFGEVFEEKQVPVETESKKEVEEKLDESMLTDEERRMVDEFSNQIDLHNSNAILQYGVGTQKKMADFSGDALENVKTKDLGEIGEMLSGVVAELKDFDEEEAKGIFGIFKKTSNKLDAMKVKYSKAETNITKICQALEQHQVQLLKDIAVLDKMYDLNLTYFKELSMYILAGKKKLQKRGTKNFQLSYRRRRADFRKMHRRQKIWKVSATVLKKKIHDLELTRMISIQTAPQIRLVQSSDTMMVEKIQSTVVNTIPLWKSQMVLALGVNHAEQAAKAQREVTDMTNELLRKNAAVLKTAAVESAKESERGIVDMETLKNTNASLISTLDEVMKIQAEGRERRRTAEVEMQHMEEELKQKLLEMSNRKG